MKTLTLTFAAAIAMPFSGLADVYVPEGGAGTALHLDEAFEPVGRIESLTDVHGLASAPKRGWLIAGSLSEVEPGEVSRPAGVSAEDHAAHHGGAKSMPDSVSIVSIVNAASHEVVKRIEVPGGVHHVEVSSDERWAIVTHPGLEAVSIIDLDSGEVTATVPTGPVPEYAVADPATGRVFISNAGNGTISDLDPAKGYVTRNFKVEGGPKHMRLLAGARRLISAEADEGIVTILDADSGETLDRIEIGGELHGVDAGLGAIYVSARERERVVRIDVATGETMEADVGPQPYHMTLVGDDLLVSSSELPMIWVLNPRTLDLKKVIPTAGTAHQIVPAFSS
ncbi:YncE family protein [Tropicimonas marinistellae]|uniref:YncE family protein n=1 Tax=Tropicimonas marinistellae TaxID=1739787 RepID=UPI000833DF95|nr:YncE family protein [Tropicimonas marinistellae]